MIRGFQCEPEQILDSRQTEVSEASSRGKRKQYLVKWKKQPKQNSTWVLQSLFRERTLILLYEEEQRLEGCELQELEESQAGKIISVEDYEKRSKLQVRAQEIESHTKVHNIQPEDNTAQLKMAHQFPVSKRNPASSVDPPTLKIKPVEETSRAPEKLIKDEPLSVDIEYLCEKRGQHLYSVKSGSSPTLLMTTEEIRQRYPNQLIDFYEKQIVRLTCIATKQTH